jgi:hypothetical protein
VAISPVYLELLKSYELVASGDRLFLDAIEHFKLPHSGPVESMKRAILRLRGLLARGGPGLSGTLRWLRLTQREMGKTATSSSLKNASPAEWFPKLSLGAMRPGCSRAQEGTGRLSEMREFSDVYDNPEGAQGDRPVPTN